MSRFANSQSDVSKSESVQGLVSYLEERWLERYVPAAEAWSRRAAVYGRAELRALRRGHLDACSVRRNWYRSDMRREGTVKITALWQNLEPFG